MNTSTMKLREFLSERIKLIGINLSKEMLRLVD